MWLLIITLGFLALLAFALFTPLRIVVDSASGQAALHWSWWGVAVVATQEGDLRYRVRLPFYTREGSVFEVEWARQPARSPSKRAPEEEVRKARRPVVSRAMLRRVVGSFQVRRFRWHMDTGDPVWNAWLFPLFHLWQVRGHDVRITFDGRSRLDVVLVNNLYRLLRAVIIR